MAKDLFSSQSSSYARYRPSYPQELFDYIFSFVDRFDLSWDCATGNGQAAVFLSKTFAHVEATDISQAQLDQAEQRPNIHYSCGAAEQSDFPDDTFDLITVAQAYHWLNWQAFFVEATRVGKPGAVVAVWGYGLPRFADEAVNRELSSFYTAVVGSYWDAERRHVDTAYETVGFDFAPLPGQSFQMPQEWALAQFRGYLESWSAVQHYQRSQGHSPLDGADTIFADLWKEETTKALHFPIFLRLGKVSK